MFRDNFKYAGVPKIEIPVTLDTFGIDTIKAYLPQIVADMKKHAKKIDYLYGYYSGDQDIKNKERKYEDNSFNAKIVENHAKAQVDFKKGYLKAIEFTHKGVVETTDDLSWLDTYLSDVSFSTVRNSLLERIYACGVGVTFDQPKKSLASKDFDTETSPFVFENLDPAQNRVVYTSVIGEESKDLFCVNISCRDVWNGIVNTKEEFYTVYTREFAVEFGFDFNQLTLEDSFRPNPLNLRKLPMIEHSINHLRLGLIEVNADMYDLINIVDSNGADNIVDVVNSILVFYNTDITMEKIRAMLTEAGAILLTDIDDVKKAKLENIVLALDHDKIDTFKTQLLTRMYDIVGVPLASANVTSGGDTGQARLLGGGWTNAYTIAQQEIAGLNKGDRELLKHWLAICKIAPNSKVDELKANQIAIKYNINRNENLQVKSQSAIYLKQIGVPIKHIVSAMELWSDEATVIRDWEKATAQEEMQTANKGLQPKTVESGESESLNLSK